MAQNVYLYCMTRPPTHWYADSSETAKAAGFRPRACDGVIRRIYVRRPKIGAKSLSWDAIGYVCDGCGELRIDREWRKVSAR